MEPNGSLRSGFASGCDFGPCLETTAGASPSLLASPNFSLTAGQWYRVSFDAATSHPSQPINVMVRRMGEPQATKPSCLPLSRSQGPPAGADIHFYTKRPKLSLPRISQPEGEEVPGSTSNAFRRALHFALQSWKLSPSRFPRLPCSYGCNSILRMRANPFPARLKMKPRLCAINLFT